MGKYTKPRKKGDKVDAEVGEWMIPEEGRCERAEAVIALPGPTSQVPGWVDKSDTLEQYLTDMAVEKFVEDNR